MARARRLRASSWVLETRQRLARSWTSWCLTRTERKAERAKRRLSLLLLETDRQLLLVKELSQHRQQLEHRQQELQESREYRLRGQLLPPPPPQ